MRSRTSDERDARTVLIVLHGEEVGGASLSVLRVAPELERMGWRIAFWAPRPSDLYDEVKRRDHEVHGRPRPLPGYSLKALRVPPGPAKRLAAAPAYYASLRRTIRRLQPSVVHCNSMYTLDEAAVARACGVATVMHVHEMVGSSRKHRIARALMHRLGHAVVGVSEASVKSLSTARHEARLVHEATHLAGLEPAPRRPRAVRTVVGTVGVIAPRKGTDLFVEAARRVRREAADIEFHLIGAPTDPLHATWAHEVLSAVSTTGIRYEPQADVTKALAGWDIFVLPSRIDPFPIVVLEAMASGLPVIGAAVDGIVEQLTPEAGVLVPPEDPEALSAAILRLHHDAGERESLGEIARARVAANFSVERQAEGLARIYADVLAGASPAPETASST